MKRFQKSYFVLVQLGSIYVLESSIKCLSHGVVSILLVEGSASSISNTWDLGAVVQGDNLGGDRHGGEKTFGDGVNIVRWSL
jgi:hypothetical protein